MGPFAILRNFATVAILLFKEPQVLRLCIWPVCGIVMTLVLTVLIWWHGISLLFPITLPAFPGSASAAWEAGSLLLHSGWNLLLQAGTTAVTYWLLFSLLSSLLFSAVCVKLDAFLGADSNPVSMSVLTQMLDILVIACILLSLNLLAFITGLLPLIGIGSALILLFLVQSLALGCEFFDCALSTRGFGLWQKIRYFRSNLATVMTIGVFSLLVLPLPVLNLGLLCLSLFSALIYVRAQERAFLFWELSQESRLWLYRRDTAMFSIRELEATLECSLADHNHQVHIGVDPKSNTLWILNQSGFKGSVNLSKDQINRLLLTTITGLRSVKIPACTA